MVPVNGRRMFRNFITMKMNKRDDEICNVKKIHKEVIRAYVTEEKESV